MTDAERHLLGLFERWRRLSVAEAQAIHAEDWSHLDELHGKKQLLQPEISLAGDHLQAELAKQGPLGEGVQQRFRDLAAELIALERENDCALAAQQQRVEQQRAELAQTSRNLRQVHAAYAPGGRPGWHTYS
jgi:small-conductance mechanosensitive channel